MHTKFHIRCRALIIDNEELLTVAHAGKSDWLVLPGGHLEAGENIQAGLERELVEELGVKPEIGQLVYVHEFVTEDNVGIVEFIFLVLNGHEFRHLNQVRSHAHEIADIVWVAQEAVLTNKKFRPQPIFDQWQKDRFRGVLDTKFI